jgi:hypothetical protein
MSKGMDDLWSNEPGDSLDGGERDDTRHIGCLIKWLKLVLPVIRSKNELVVALYLYRLQVVRRSKTISVSNEWLRDVFGIARFVKYRALERLMKAGLVKVERRNKAALKVTFLR